jgi:hypothetical protein
MKSKTPSINRMFQSNMIANAQAVQKNERGVSDVTGLRVC